MKIVGLIAEYNPFHNGHKYHLEESLKKTNATHSVVVMSGNFLQRGEPALVDKFKRAKMAVLSGVDLVLEIPPIFACQSAEFFAKGAVTLLDSINCVDSICFGSEVDDIEFMKKVAFILENQAVEYKDELKVNLNKGMRFPVARSEALKTYFNKQVDHSKKKVSVENCLCENRLYLENKFYDESDKFEKKESIDKILQSSNSILGIEYIKALISLNSSIEPVSIKRISSEYNSEELTGTISSATAIRNYLNEKYNDKEKDNVKDEDLVKDKNSSKDKDNAKYKDSVKVNDNIFANLDLIARTIPESTYKILKDILQENCDNFCFANAEMFFEILRSIIIREGTSINKYFDVNEGIENKIYKEIFSAKSYEDLCNKLKSKRYTFTRIKRMLNNIMLGITKEQIFKLKEIKSFPYCRVLAFNDKGREILKEIKNNSEIEVITKFSNTRFNQNNEIYSMLIESDIKDTNIYNSIVLAKKNNKTNNFKGPVDYYISPFYRKY